MPHPPASLPERAMPGRSFRLRARVVAGLFCAVCFAGLAARLAWLQLAGADGYAQRALGQQLRDTAVPAGRGLILSADGVVLATNASCWTIRACPREMPEARLELAAQGLGDILELDPARLLEQFRQRSSNDCLLRRRVDQDTAGAVRDFCQQNGIAGIRILQDTRRQYPEGAFLASVLGFTNVDNVGAAGLELEYNDALAGQDGRVLTAVNAWGYALEQSYAVLQPPVQGNTLVLTIDAAIQRYLENALTYAVAEHHAAARGVGIVLDVDTGAVVAMATVPRLRPQPAPVDLRRGPAGRRGRPDRPGPGRRPPAGPAGPVAQQGGQRPVRAGQRVQADHLRGGPGRRSGGPRRHLCLRALHLSVAGTRFHCANRKRHGVQTVTEALMNSCNQSLIQMARAGWAKRLSATISRPLACGRPPASTCRPEPAKSLYYTAGRMGPVELASCSFGQSSKVSYIGMAAAVAAIVNGGRLMRPYVVAEVRTPAGALVQKTQPACVRQVIRPETSALMRQMMEAVVAGGGGQKAQIAGYRVGGKSGTSQKLDSDDPTARIASFVAVAPIDDPQLLCLICLDEPHSWSNAGGSLSAPVCAEVLEQALVHRGVPRSAVPAAPALAELPADGDTFSGE